MSQLRIDLSLRPRPPFFGLRLVVVVVDAVVVVGFPGAVTDAVVVVGFPGAVTVVVVSVVVHTAASSASSG